MSFLIVKEKGKVLKRKQLDIICNRSNFKEICIVFNLRGSLVRRANFGSLDEVDSYVAKNVPKESSLLVYADDPDRKYPVSSYSPLIITDRWAFASCGNMLKLTDKHNNMSNAEVFLKQILRPTLKKWPEVLHSDAWIYLVKTVARPYIALAFIDNQGIIVLINQDRFDVIDGIKYADFSANKRDYDKAPNGVTKTGSKTVYSTGKGSKTVYH